MFLRTTTVENGKYDKKLLFNVRLYIRRGQANYLREKGKVTGLLEGASELRFERKWVFNIFENKFF